MKKRERLLLPMVMLMSCFLLSSKPLIAEQGAPPQKVKTTVGIEFENDYEVDDNDEGEGDGGGTETSTDETKPTTDSTSSTAPSEAAASEGAGSTSDSQALVDGSMPTQTSSSHTKILPQTGSTRSDSVRWVGLIGISLLAYIISRRFTDKA